MLTEASSEARSFFFHEDFPQALAQFLSDKQLRCGDCNLIQCEFCWNIKRAFGRLYYFRNFACLTTAEKDFILVVKLYLNRPYPALSREHLWLLEQLMIRRCDYGDDLASNKNPLTR